MSIVILLCVPLALVYLAVRRAPLVDEDGNRIEE
jgi:hypothetical protein